MTKIRTVSQREASQYSDGRPGYYLTCWTSADGQSSLWLGYGATARQSEQDALRLADEQGIDCDAGDLTAHLIVED